VKINPYLININLKISSNDARKFNSSENEKLKNRKKEFKE